MTYSVATLAYTAGILDGEGHFSIMWNKPHDRYYHMVGVANTNLDLLKWLQSHFDGSIYRRLTPPEKSHWKQRYEWRASHKGLDVMLPGVLPFLLIKKRHAEIILAFRATFTTGLRGSLINNPTALLERRRLREELVMLNDSHRTKDAIDIATKIKCERADDSSWRHSVLMTQNQLDFDL